LLPGQLQQAVDQFGATGSRSGVLQLICDDILPAPSARAIPFNFSKNVD